MYLVIQCDEDGVIFTQFASKKLLLEDLAKNANDDPDRDLWFDEIRVDWPKSGKDFWELGNDIIILKAELVEPVAKKAVTVYEI
jgi:hypothetical protein